MRVTVNWRVIALVFLAPTRLVFLTLAGPVGLIYLLNQQEGLKQLWPLLKGGPAVGMTVVVLIGLLSLWFLAREVVREFFPQGSAQNPEPHPTIPASAPVARFQPPKPRRWQDAR